MWRVVYFVASLLIALIDYFQLQSFNYRTIFIFILSSIFIFLFEFLFIRKKS